MDFLCSHNQLTELMLSNISKSLGSFYCNSNQLTTEALNDLFGTLPDNVFGGGNAYVWDNPGAASFANGAIINGWKIITVNPD